MNTVMHQRQFEDYCCLLTCWQTALLTSGPRTLPPCPRGERDPGSGGDWPNGVSTPLPAPPSPICPRHTELHDKGMPKIRLGTWGQ